MFPAGKAYYGWKKCVVDECQAPFSSGKTCLFWTAHYSISSFLLSSMVLLVWKFGADLLKTIFAEGSVSSYNFKLSYQTVTVLNEDDFNTAMCPAHTISVWAEVIYHQLQANSWSLFWGIFSFVLGLTLSFCLNCGSAVLCLQQHSLWMKTLFPS